MLKASKNKSQDTAAGDVYKEMRFDEKNLDETCNPQAKSCGHMTMKGAKTPFPRKEAPVDAALLRDRLMRNLSRLNQSLFYEDDKFELGMDVPVSSSEASFQTKVRQFYSSEDAINRPTGIRHNLQVPKLDTTFNCKTSSSSSSSNSRGNQNSKMHIDE